MTVESHPQIYNSIGIGYRKRRVPDHRIAAQIERALGDAGTVCNVGAGTGSYEPVNRDVTAVEPSQTMINQRSSTNRVVCASAESMPFTENQFDATMAVLSVHHWIDAKAGLAEMKRISKRQVILTFDPDMMDSLWLIRDYLPESGEFERRRAVPIREIVDVLKPARVEPVDIPWDCEDGFQGAYWRRPEAYLNPDVRAAISTFAQLPAIVVSNAIRRLTNDLESGEWQVQNADILELDSMDLGYRMVVSESHRD